jgi:hypothetical protein
MVAMAGKYDALKKGQDVAAMNVGVCFQAHAIDGSAEARPPSASPGAAKPKRATDGAAATKHTQKGSDAAAQRDEAIDEAMQAARTSLGGPEPGRRGQSLHRCGHAGHFVSSRYVRGFSILVRAD